MHRTSTTRGAKLNLRTLWICIIAGVACALPFAAAAQELGQYLLNTRSGADMPAKATIGIRISNDTELNLKVRDEVIAALTRTGHRMLDDGADVVIWVESQFIDNSRRRAEPIGEFRAGSTVGGPQGALNDIDKTQMDVKLRLWSSSKNSLLRPDNRGADIQRGFEIILNAYDNARGHHLWQGSIRAADTGGDAAGISRDMVPPLVSALGKTVDNRTIQTD